MTRSVKHHYIPQFFLKGFTGTNGKFFIFDHKNGRLKKGEYAPASHFYVKDRNTLFHGNDSSDLIEEHHSHKDTRFAKLFKKIQSERAPLDIPVDEFVILQWFIWDLYWRLPSNDDLFMETYWKDKRFQNFWVVRNRETGQIIDDDNTKQLKLSDEFIRSNKSTYAEYLFMLNDRLGIDNPYDWRFLYAESGFHVLGDSPVILLDNNQSNILNAQFVVPLSKEHYLIKTSLTPSIGRLPPEFSMFLDILQFKSSKNYSACINRDHLRCIEKQANLHDIDYFKSMVINMIN